MKTTITCLDGKSRPLSIEYRNFLTEVDVTLRKRADYVGVAPYGSQFKGVNKESSDFDVILIAGDGSFDTQASLNILLNSVAAKYDKTAHAFEMWDASFFEANFRSEFGHAYYHVLWPLAYDFIGKPDKLKHLGALAKKKHAQAKKIDPRFAENSLTSAVHDLIYWELGVHVAFVGDTIVRSSISKYDENAEKIMARGYSRTDLRDIAVARAHMWLKRIRSFVNN